MRLGAPVRGRGWAPAAHPSAERRPGGALPPPQGAFGVSSCRAVAGAASVIIASSRRGVAAVSKTVDRTCLFVLFPDDVVHI